MEKELFATGKYPPQADINHFNNCSGCASCDYMMQFFGQCFCCDVIIHKRELYVDIPANDYYCEDCVGAMPKHNTNEFVLCGHCYKRDIRENMHMYHENFITTWTCGKCAEDSVVNSRFELLDF